MIYSKSLLRGAVLGCLLATTSFAAASPSKYWSDKRVIALVEAGKAGNAKRVAQLVAQGVPVNAVGKDGLTPLAYVMLNLSKKGFTALLQNGADPDILVPALPSGDGSISCLAAQGEELFWLEQLAAAGADLNIRSIDAEKTPLYYAIVKNRIENIRFLIANKAGLDVVDVSGYSPVQYAAMIGSWHAVYLMIDAGADWTKKLRKGQTLVDQIALFSSMSTVDKTGEGWTWRNKVILLLDSKGCKIPPELLASAQ